MQAAIFKLQLFVVERQLEVPSAFQLNLIIAYIT